MAGYIRQDVTNNIATGNVINASDFDNEYNAIEAAFHASTGHTHDGTAAEGAPITKIGPTQDVVASASALTPKTDNTVDLGSSILEYKDLWLDGTANIDSLVADTADINAGTIDGVTIGGAVRGAGSFTTLDANGNTTLGDVVGDTVTVNGTTTFVNAAPTLTPLTASQAVFTNASKELVSNAITGTGNVVMSASPTFTGTIGAAAATLSGNLTLSAGTANGVLYLDGSKVATSGSALTFDGTNFSTTGTATATKLVPTGNVTAGNGMYLPTTNELAWSNNGSETMRLTSTGLGIGTSSPGQKLEVAGNIRIANTYSLLMGSGAEQKIFAAGSANNTYLTFNQWTGSAYTERMRLDSSGNLGLGVTPSAWGSANIAAQIGARMSLWSAGSSTIISNNQYRNSANARIYLQSGYAAEYQQDAGNGAHVWLTAPSGTAGNAISFTQALTLDASGNLLLGGTSAGASSAASLAIFNGTAPTGSVTNGIILYAEDVSSSSELKVRDEAGNVTTLSPHNFSLIPEGPSEDMAWAYYSEKGGKRINVDMLKLARMVEKLTGEKLVYES